MMESKIRNHSHEIAIDAPIERVFRALIDEADLTQWYVSHAEVDPCEGGRYWISWGEGMEGENRIERFDPPNRLVLSLQPPPEHSPAAATVPKLDKPIIEEFTLSSEGGVTTLRLVNSGIPDTPEWNDFYDGTNAGWDRFLIALRTHLTGEPERGADKPVSRDRLDGTFANVRGRFRADRAEGLNAVVQYHLTGDASGDWIVTVRDGALTIEPGVHDAPTMTIAMDAADYVDLATGKLTGQQAFTGGKMKVGGDTKLIVRWGKLFEPLRT